jgi:hypothetical protein
MTFTSICGFRYFSFYLLLSEHLSQSTMNFRPRAPKIIVLACLKTLPFLDNMVLDLVWEYTRLLRRKYAPDDML